MPTFSKHERLKSRKTIAQLFKDGNSFMAYPLRVVWLATEEEEGEFERARVDEREGFTVRIVISVPKKNFKTAVARNRIKRQIREAYRLRKEDFYKKLAEQHVAIMLMYIAKEALPYTEIEAGVKKMIKKWPLE